MEKQKVIQKVRDNCMMGQRNKLGTFLTISCHEIGAELTQFTQRRSTILRRYEARARARACACAAAAAAAAALSLCRHHLQQQFIVSCYTIY